MDVLSQECEHERNLQLAEARAVRTSRRREGPWEASINGAGTAAAQRRLNGKRRQRERDRSTELAPIAALVPGGVQPNSCASLLTSL